MRGTASEELNLLIRQPTKQNRIKQHIYLTIILRGRVGYEMIYIYIYIYIYSPHSTLGFSPTLSIN